MPKSKYSDISKGYLTGAESDVYECPVCHAYLKAVDYEGTTVTEEVLTGQAKYATYSLAHGFLLRITSITDNVGNAVEANIISYELGTVEVLANLVGDYLKVSYVYDPTGLKLCPHCGTPAKKGT